MVRCSIEYLQIIPVVFLNLPVIATSLINLLARTNFRGVLVVGYPFPVGKSLAEYSIAQQPYLIDITPEKNMGGGVSIICGQNFPE